MSDEADKNSNADDVWKIGPFFAEEGDVYVNSHTDNGFVVLSTKTSKGMIIRWFCSSKIDSVGSRKVEGWKKL